jgi:hypothetical protein
MNRIRWWLIALVSRMLEAEEREAVHGDLAESGAASGSALRDILGLALRRQAALCTGWQPWLMFMCLVAPLGMILSLATSRLGDGTVYVWMYADNLDWDLMRNAGFWYELAHVALILFILYANLVCMSWATGFVLGSLSRRLAWVNGALFCLTLLFAAFVAVPLYLAYYERYLHRTFGAPVPLGVNLIDPLHGSTFYHLLFPLLVQLVLVVAPALRGIRQGVRSTRFRPLLRAILWAAAMATMAAMLLQIPGVGVLFLHRRIAHKVSPHPALIFGPMQMLGLLVYWPVLYLAVSTIEERRRVRTVSA